MEHTQRTGTSLRTRKVRLGLKIITDVTTDDCAGNEHFHQLAFRSYLDGVQYFVVRVSDDSRSPGAHVVSVFVPDQSTNYVREIGLRLG